MLPRVNSSLLKHFKPIASSSEGAIDYDSSDSISGNEQNLDQNQHPPNRPRTKKGQSPLKLIIPPPDTPFSQNPTQILSKPPEFVPSFSLVELRNTLISEPKAQEKGMRTYIEAINRVKRIGTSRKGIILDNEAE